MTILSYQLLLRFPYFIRLEFSLFVDTFNPLSSFRVRKLKLDSLYSRTSPCGIRFPANYCNILLAKGNIFVIEYQAPFNGFSCLA